MKVKIAVLSAILLWAVAAHSVVPRTLSFQGALRDGSGLLVPDGDYEVTFRIYDVEVDGAHIWEESQTVPVTGSLFSAVLGETNSLDLAFDEQYWIELRVGSDPWMEPRIPLTAAPYSLNVAEGQAVTSLNSVTDDVTLAGGGSITVNQAGQTITISDGGGGTFGESLIYPDGFEGMEPVIWGLMGLMPYTVPAGKNLYITTIYCPNGDELRIDGLGIMNFEGNAPTKLPIIAGPGQVLTTPSPGIVYFNGFLVDAVVTPITVDVSLGGYSAPPYQTFVITNIYTNRNESAYWDLTINGAVIYRVSMTDQTYALDQPILIKGGLHLSTSAPYTHAIVVNGYLR